MKAHLLILGTVALATCASASIVSYSATILKQATSSPYAFNLVEFDPSLGTLTGVTLVLDATATTSVSILNFNTYPTAYSDGTISFNFVLTGPGGSGGQVAFSAGPFSGTAAAGPGSPGYSTTYSAAVDLAKTGTFVVGQSNWANYEGTGGLTLTGRVPGVSPGGSISNGFVGNGPTTVGGTASVIYDYAAAEVPEPATLVLLGSALLGLGAIRRRKS